MKNFSILAALALGTLTACGSQASLPAASHVQATAASPSIAGFTPGPLAETTSTLDNGLQVRYDMREGPTSVTVDRSGICTVTLDRVTYAHHPAPTAAYGVGLCQQSVTKQTGDYAQAWQVRYLEACGEKLQPLGLPVADGRCQLPLN